MLFFYAISVLNTFGIAYLHVIEGETRGDRDYYGAVDYGAIRRAFKGTYIGNNGYTAELASKRLSSGDTDLVAFGRSFLANPDLVDRLRNGLNLNPPHQATFYGGDHRGYTDYPAMADQ
ncbi:MAG: hypothetical protein EOP18_06485 [Rhizobiaceae bacterium]|nr:MAG: hypothetical protein EOP18_06485 [Rhizobiaceae bacterium]